MAVTVQQAPFVVLDEEYRIVEVGPFAAAGLGPLAGQILWECFPGSERLFRPYYEQARGTGKPVEFVQYYNGHVVELHVEPRGVLLDVYWRGLHVIDALTLDRLERSITRMIELLDGTQVETFGARARGSLRLIVDGA